MLVFYIRFGIMKERMKAFAFFYFDLAGAVPTALFSQPKPLVFTEVFGLDN